MKRFLKSRPFFNILRRPRVFCLQHRPPRCPSPGSRQLSRALLARRVWPPLLNDRIKDLQKSSSFSPSSTSPTRSLPCSLRQRPGPRCGGPGGLRAAPAGPLRAPGAAPPAKPGPARDSFCARAEGGGRSGAAGLSRLGKLPFFLATGEDSGAQAPAQSAAASCAGRTGRAADPMCIQLTRAAQSLSVESLRPVCPCVSVQV